jgi:UDP-N-acetylmuramyl pentapeptide synthase
MLYKFQLCGYRAGAFLKIAGKRTEGRVKWTARARRIYGVSLVLAVLFLGLPLLFMRYTVVVADFLLTPWEKAIKRKWIKKAQKKLNSPEFANLTVIGITGSYGKTSCKNILAEILRTQFRVLSSPESFNTPMGFARTVNEHLTPDTEILIMEMGARKRGDIAEMCGLSKPVYGIITAIGNQHLETFGNLENIRLTKMELADFVKKENLVVFDDCPPEQYETGLLGEHNQRNIGLCVKMARKLGITEDNIKTAVKHLRPTPHRLELIEAPNGIKILDDSYNSNTEGAKVALRVLGDLGGRVGGIGGAGDIGVGIGGANDGANSDVGGADGVGVVGGANGSAGFGVGGANSDVGGVGVVGGAGVGADGGAVNNAGFVVGDANGNIGGAGGGAKVVQTAGFVEQGGNAYKSNFDFGVQISGVADFVIIMGRLNKTAIYDGLTSANFPMEQIFFADNISAAKEIYPKILHSGDILLIENDLPENY